MNLARLAKVWELTRSANAGEAAAARERARVMMAQEGMTLDDVPRLLRGESPQKPQAPPPDPSAFYDLNNPVHRAAFAEMDRKRRSDRARRERPARDEVLKRYGSLAAVLAWTEQERLLRASVMQWATFQPPPHDRWTKSLDGHQITAAGPPSDRVTRALSKAYPLPATVTEAAAEFAMWGKRDRDLGLVMGASDDTQLDLPAYLRREIVRRLLEVELRAVSLSEIVIRQRHLVDMDTIGDPDIEKAVLADLEGLLEAERKRPEASASPTADRPVPEPPIAERTAPPRPAEVPPRPAKPRARRSSKPTKAQQPDMFG